MSNETSRSRRSRVELDYYRRPDAFARWRGRLALLLGTLAIGWVALAPVWGGGTEVRLFQWKRLASPGPLATPHALWESRCEACHRPFEAVSSAAPGGVPSAPGLASDGRCQTCHATSPHHPAQPEPPPSCGRCHRDHEGREVSLVAGNAAECVACHADLPAHRRDTGPEASIVASISAFDGDPSHHPEFSWARPGAPPDPGRITFNHALHLRPGLVRQEGAVPFTVSRLPVADRDRYAATGSQSGSPVQLVCGSCHEPEASLRDRFAMGAALGGSLMRPIAFDRHCRSCHSLSYSAVEPPVPHGLPPAAVIDVLRDRAASALLGGDPTRLDRFIPPRPRPDRPDDPEPVRLREALEARVLASARILFGSGAAPAPAAGASGGCRLCHALEPRWLDHAPGAALATLAATPIEPAAIPAVWSRRSVFDHAAHRALDCLACHEHAPASERTSDVLLPPRAACLACHGPERRVDGVAIGGAGHDCNECHRYHSRGLPATPGAAVPLDVRAFLDGVRLVPPGEPGSALTPR